MGLEEETDRATKAHEYSEQISGAGRRRKGYGSREETGRALICGDDYSQLGCFIGK